jgi:hypothetical protein
MIYWKTKMAVKLEGPAAKEYKELFNKIKTMMYETSMNRHMTNLGYLLNSKGIIKNPQQLYNNIEDILIRAIIDLKINQK